MKPQHTPGPWELQRKTKPTKTRKYYEHGESFVVMGRNNSYFGLAEVSGPCNFDMQEELRANAALIAAAPELLEVLEDVADRWDVYDDEDAPELGQRIRAAIAKATGGTP